MSLTPIFDPEKAGRPMRVAAFMSGSGTNITKLLEHEKHLRAEQGASPFEVLFIYSDRSDGACAGEKIAHDHGLPYFSYDIRVFHQKRSLQRTARTAEGLAARKAYDRIPGTLVGAFGVDVIALGGYMSYVTLSTCVNVHPADLSIRTPEGQRKYVGDHAVRDAISCGELELRASTLWTDEGVDTAPLLMVSEPLTVELPGPLEEILKDPETFDQVVNAHQEQLKEKGDWKIFPKTVELIARGRFALDEKKRVYLDREPVPRGYRGS